MNSLIRADEKPIRLVDVTTVVMMNESVVTGGEVVDKKEERVPQSRAEKKDAVVVEVDPQLREKFAHMFEELHSTGGGFEMKSFGCDQEDEYRAYFDKYGFVVIDGVIESEQCDRTLDEVWFGWVVCGSLRFSNAKHLWIDLEAVDCSQW